MRAVSRTTFVAPLLPPKARASDTGRINHFARGRLAHGKFLYARPWFIIIDDWPQYGPATEADKLYYTAQGVRRLRRNIPEQTAKSRMFVFWAERVCLRKCKFSTALSFHTRLTEPCRTPCRDRTFRWQPRPPLHAALIFVQPWSRTLDNEGILDKRYASKPHQTRTAVPVGVVSTSYMKRKFNSYFKRYRGIEQFFSIPLSRKQYKRAKHVRFVFYKRIYRPVFNNRFVKRE